MRLFGGQPVAEYEVGVPRLCLGSGSGSGLTAPGVVTCFLRGPRFAIRLSAGLKAGSFWLQVAARLKSCPNEKHILDAATVDRLQVMFVGAGTTAASWLRCAE